jgi:hypothetical protein
MNQWVVVDPCSSTSVSGGANVFMEVLTVLGPNTASTLSRVPDMVFFMLTINGDVFQPVGPSPPFTVASQTIIWQSTIFGFNTGDVLVASYSY